MPHECWTSRGKLVAPAVVVIANGRIVSVGSGGVPAGARTIDLGDLTLLPGLIDAHTHLTGDISGDWVTRSVRELPADAALRGARNAPEAFEQAILTALAKSPDARPGTGSQLLQQMRRK